MQKERYVDVGLISCLLVEIFFPLPLKMVKNCCFMVYVDTIL